MPNEILIDGVIGRQVNSKRIREELSKFKNERVIVRISSRGGDFMEGISIFNALTEHKAGVDGIIEGPCFSAAAVIALACNTLRMKENTLLMFHPVKLRGEMLGLENIDKIKEDLQSHQEILVETLSTKMQISKEAVENFISQEKFLKPQEALFRRLIDEIIPVKRGRMNLVNFFESESEAPSEVLAYVNEFNRRSKSMSLHDVVAELNLSIENLSEDTEDSVLQEAIVNSFNSLNTRISELEKELDKKEEKKSDPEPIVTGTMVNMVQEYRGTKIDNFVSQGKLTPAAAQKIKAKHCSEQAARDCYLNEDAKSAFDSVVEAIEANDNVVNLGGKSGVQMIPKGSEDQNLLASLMEKRFNN